MKHNTCIHFYVLCVCIDLVFAEPPQKLLAARNFTVVGQPRLQRTNGTVYALLAWRPPPASTHPQRQQQVVDKYRLSWQLRPSATEDADADTTASSGNDANSLLVVAASPSSPNASSTWIFEPQHQHEFFDLRANAEYVVQLQAFGPKRAKSPVETLLLSTLLVSPAEQMQRQSAANR